MRAPGWWQAMGAEIVKQHRNRAKGRMVFFSLLLWPVLAFVSSYFAMLPYNAGEHSALSRIIPPGGVPLFLLSGYLVFQLFWSVVQAAWLFQEERRSGTLEVIFLTPSSKMAFLYGRSLHALLHGIWMFAVFSLLLFWFVADASSVHWPALLTSFPVIGAAAVAWGGQLNALSLFSRDSGLIYYIFQAPMELFGGVRVPPAVFPVWASSLSLLFPLTYSLVMVRGALNNDVGTDWWIALATLGAIAMAMAGTTRLTLTAAERHARRRGNWQLF